MDVFIEILKKAGIEVPSNKREVIREAVGEKYKPIAEVEKLSLKLEQAEENYNKLKEDAKARDSDLKKLQEKLKSSNSDSEVVEKLTKELDEMKEKYKKANEEHEKALSERAYEFSIRELANSLSFSSNAAKKSFVNEAISKKLSMDGDKILGFDDFVKEFKESDPNALREAPGEDKKKAVFGGRFGNNTGDEENEKTKFPTLI